MTENIDGVIEVNIPRYSINKVLPYIALGIAVYALVAAIKSLVDGARLRKQIGNLDDRVYAFGVRFNSMDGSEEEGGSESQGSDSDTAESNGGMRKHPLRDGAIFLQPSAVKE